jgi:glycosyltransferase involved in cell wall biosynthesis
MVATDPRSLPLRVTFVSRRAWPAVGGISNHLRLLSGALPPLDRVQILTPRADNEWPRNTDVLRRHSFPSLSKGQVTTEALRLRGHRWVRALWVAAEPRLQWVPRGRGWLARRSFNAYATAVGSEIARRADRPSILHVLGGGNLAAAGIHAARRLGVPVAISPSAHPGQWDDDPQSGSAYRAADVILAWGEADARTYLDLGVSPERIRHLPPCFAELPRGDGTDVRTKHRVAGPLVVFVGARQPYKGLDILLDALAKLAGRIPGLTLAAVGNGPPLPATSGGARLIDVGFANDSEKAAWIRAADVLCLPSAHESFGIAVAEAMSVGTPVVTSDIPPLAALIESSGAGLAVPRAAEPLARAIGDVLANEDGLAERMGAAGERYWRENLRLDVVVARTLGEYARLVA